MRVSLGQYSGSSSSEEETEDSAAARRSLPEALRSRNTEIETYPMNRNSTAANTDVASAIVFRLRDIPSKRPVKSLKKADAFSRGDEDV